MKLAARALAVLIFVAAAPARAEESADVAADQAEALAEQAYLRYAAGRDAEAIELYLRAYAAAPSARMLLDVAEIYDARLHDRDRAADYYRRYLDSPDAEADLADRARARKEALAAPPPPTATAPAASTEPRRSSGVPLRTWGFVAGGAGLGAIALGTVFALVAKSKNDDASRSCTGQACTDPRALTLTDEAASAARVADVAFVLGGVLVAAGGAIVLFSPTPRGLSISGGFP